MIYKRPFKFRIWDSYKNCWSDEKEYIGISNSGVLCNSKSSSNNISLMDDVIIQQFTGYIDKNKKEIYEGDIVKADLKHTSVLLGEDYLLKYTCGEIKWYNAKFNVCQTFVGGTPLSEFATCSCCPCGLEIIGNIFENPELENAKQTN